MKDERGVDIRSKENIKEEETVPGTERICTFMYAYFLCLQLLFEVCMISILL